MECVNCVTFSHHKQLKACAHVEKKNTIISHCLKWAKWSPCFYFSSSNPTTTKLRTSNSFQRGFNVSIWINGRRNRIWQCVKIADFLIKKKHTQTTSEKFHNRKIRNVFSLFAHKKNGALLCVARRKIIANSHISASFVHFIRHSFTEPYNIFCCLDCCAFDEMGW